MELMSIGKFAKKVGVHPRTLRRMEADGRLKPYYVSEGGTRYYSTEQLREFNQKSELKRIVVGYCRVSSHLKRMI